MCVGRVNVLNRQNQGGLRNFKAYTKGVETTVADLRAIRDANAVSKWLRYRISQPATGQSKYFTLDEDDYALCAVRTVTFVNALGDTLTDKMPHAKMLDNFDIFHDSSSLPPADNIAALDSLYDTFLKVCIFNYSGAGFFFYHC
jgi:hypothetical protein